MKPTFVKLVLKTRGAKNLIRSKVRLILIPNLIKKAAEDGIFAVNICNTNGLGAKLEWVLECLAYCDEHGLKPAFKFSYPDDRDTDYFGPFFSIRPVFEAKASRFIRIESIPELGWKESYDSIMTFQLAEMLIKKYLLIKSDVIEEVNSFCQANFRGKEVLGIHYRGTDKVGEAPNVPYESVLRNVLHFAKLQPGINAVFLSTDDKNFELYFSESFKECPVIIRKDSFRSVNGIAIHQSRNVDKYYINRDAVINCLLLSKCCTLIKTTSFLSDWSKLFNPQLPIIMLNKPYERALWFPAREILKEVLYEPLG